MSGKRFLFQVRNRRGLGHMMRGLNIARELRRIDPTADILFYMRSAPADGFWPDDINFVVEPDPEALSAWPSVLMTFRPDVVVYDTMLPKCPADEPVAANARYAYIMRKCLADEQREVFANLFLDRMATIIVPHEPAEFGYAVPSAIRARTRFVGPIVRLPDQESQRMVRSRYLVPEGGFLLTSTVGGGGFDQQAEQFFAAVGDAHRRFAAVIPALRHVLVKGPNFKGRLAAMPGVTVVDVEPDMINLLAASDLVVAEGGYNTVNEVRISKTPAVFMPSVRGKDNQEERVRKLEAAGFGRVIAPASGERLAAEVRELATTPGLLDEIRERYRGDNVMTGNRAAARQLWALLS